MAVIKHNTYMGSAVLHIQVMNERENIMNELTNDELFAQLRAWSDALPQHSGIDDGLTPHERLAKIIPLMDEALDRDIDSN